MSLGFDSATVVTDLHWLARSAGIRCVYEAEEWAREMLYYLPEEWHQYTPELPEPYDEINTPERTPAVRRIADFGRSLIKKREFKRAAYFLKEIKDASQYDRFMYFWARYLACERDRVEMDADTIDYRTQYDNRDLVDLHNELSELGCMSPDVFDTYLLYVFGKMRRSLKLKDNSKQVFNEAVVRNRANWLAWEELVTLVGSVDEAYSAKYTEGNHWMHQIFIAEVYTRFQLHRNAMEQLDKLSQAGFDKIPYIMNQVAASYNNMQEHEMGMNVFKKVRKVDPYRIEQMHLYSDSLYVRGMRSDLANLTHFFFKSHKFAWETCLIVANYYSLRGEHDRAVLFLQRSLKINPFNACAWTLIGHEFMEQKNNSAACLAYRKAIETDYEDYRGWYGLGQLYDILKMPSYSLYYYQQAHKCRPDDSRMLVALGEVYDRLDRYADAQKCFLKAFKVGDVEGTALMLLGQLFEKKNDEDQAAMIYQKYLDVYGEQLMDDVDNMATCCSFLAKHYLKKNDLNTASAFAQRCLEYDSTKEEGRNLLRQISQKHHRMSITPTTIAQYVSTPKVDTSTQPGAQAQTSPSASTEAGLEGPEFRSPVVEGEADMAISSDDGSVSDESSSHTD